MNPENSSSINSNKFEVQPAEIYIQSGWKAYVAKDIPLALSNFQQAVQLDQRVIDGHYGLGLTLKLEGKIPEALNEFNVALDLAQNESSIINSSKRTILRQLITTQIMLLDQ